jgi:hypothetical protein
MGIYAYAAAAVIGLIAGSQSGKSKTPPLQAATAPPESQAAKAPDASSIAAGQAGQGQAGGAPGVAQTFLTGPGGIDPSLLNLGKTTLLGG